MSEELLVGIDVCKAELQVACYPGAGRCVFTNDEAGIEALAAHLREGAPPLVVLEATGGWEVPVTSALVNADIPTAVVNPRQVRDFAKATGQLAKTDAIDASVLAHFAKAVRPQPRPLPQGVTAELKALVTRPRQTIGMLTAEKNRLASAPETVHAQIEAHLAWLKKQLACLDNDLAAQVSASPRWREKGKLLRSVPSTIGSIIGPKLATNCRASLSRPTCCSSSRSAGTFGWARADGIDTRMATTRAARDQRLDYLAGRRTICLSSLSVRVLVVHGRVGPAPASYLPPRGGADQVERARSRLATLRLALPRESGQGQTLQRRADRAHPGRGGRRSGLRALRE
jgi:hypothetical protein